MAIEGHSVLPVLLYFYASDRTEGGNKRCFCPSVRSSVCLFVRPSRTQRIIQEPKGLAQASLSAGMRRERVPPQNRKKERKKAQHAQIWNEGSPPQMRLEQQFQCQTVHTACFFLEVRSRRCSTVFSSNLYRIVTLRCNLIMLFSVGRNDDRGTLSGSVLYKNSQFSANISLCLGNDAMYGHSYNGRRIGIRTRSIKWCHFQ